MSDILVAGPGDAALARALAGHTGGRLASGSLRHFPDGELYVRIDTPLAGEVVWIVSTLHPANERILPAYLMGCTARDLGAKRVFLVAPYLAYLRQDHRFRDGEGITSHYMSRLLSTVFDGLVTVDPHLHRIDSLAEIYEIPTRVVGSAPRLAEWIRKHVEMPALFGPDAESEQWVRRVAEVLDCPWMVLTKQRRGDRDVSVSSIAAADAARAGIDPKRHQPVLLDDIASTGRTLIEAVGSLAQGGYRVPVCAVVHAVFAADAYDDLSAAGPARVISCNTIAHSTNTVDVLDLVASAMEELERSLQSPQLV